MKKSLFIAAMMAVTAVLFTACEEEKPPINFNPPTEVLLDTTYTSPVPAADNKAVLLYDVTGVRCNNCPKAAARAKILDSIYKERLHILAVYPTASPTLTEPWPGYEKLTTEQSQLLVESLGAFSSLPTGCIDQAEFSSTRFVAYPQWDARVSERISVASPLNINISSIYDNAKGYQRLEAKVTLHTNYTDPGNLALMVAISEDSIPGLQSSTLVSGGLDYNYVHYHVLREIVTPQNGSPLTSSTLEAGRTFEKHFRLPLKPNWRKSKLHVVAWVINTQSKVVLQSAEIKY